MKKGMFFTFMAIFLTILIVAMITTTQTFRYREKTEAIASRVRTMNNFISDLEKDFDREMYIGGYRSILSVNSHIRQEEEYAKDFKAVFTEIMTYGTANSTPMSLMEQGTQGAAIDSWLMRVNEEAGRLSIHVDMEVHDIWMYHIDPWNVEMAINTTMFIEDQKGLASWNFTKTYKKEFSILGFEDPLYIVETEDKVTNIINETSYTFGNSSQNLSKFLEKGQYVHNTDAPSYLMRFSGNLSGSPYGIEGFVHLENLDQQNIPLKKKSVVDHIYFGNKSTNDYCNVTGMPEWFRIDEDHADFYEVEDYESC